MKSKERKKGNIIIIQGYKAVLVRVPTSAVTEGFSASLKCRTKTGLSPLVSRKSRAKNGHRHRL